METLDTMYIDGRFEAVRDREILTLVDPVTEQDAAQVVLADEEDARRAIAAAAHAYRRLAGSTAPSAWTGWSACTAWWPRPSRSSPNA